TTSTDSYVLSDRPPSLHHDSLPPCPPLSVPLTVEFPSFFLTAPAPAGIYPLSLHDALPIYPPASRRPSSRSPVRSCTSAGSPGTDRKSTRLNSSHVSISYAVFCLKKKKTVADFSLFYTNSINKQHSTKQDHTWG